MQAGGTVNIASEVTSLECNLTAQPRRFRR